MTEDRAERGSESPRPEAVEIRRSRGSGARRLFSHRIIQNALALSWIQVATFIVPLMTLPYVTRILGSSVFGLVVFSQSYSSLIGIFIDFGFEASMPRLAAAARDDRAQLSTLAADVFGARLLLIAPTMVVAFVGYATVAKLHGHPLYVVLAWVAAVAQGLSPAWFFLGLERLRLVSFLQFFSRILAAALTFIFVRNRHDGWIVLLLFAGGSVLSFVSGTVIIYRHVDFRQPHFRASLRAIRRTSTLFLGITALSLYSAANVFILGLLTTSRKVAYYAAAERVVRAIIQLLAPLALVVYPRIAYLHATNEQARARRLARLTVGALGVIGLLTSATLLVAAPLIINVVYGHTYHPSIAVLRILGLMMIPISLQATLSGGWMLALHMDRAIVKVALAGGAVNIVAALILVPLLGPVGMACAALSAEMTVLIACVISVRVAERRAGRPGLLYSPRELDEPQPVQS